MKRDLEESLPLTAGIFHILLALAGGEQHGYSIIKEVESSSNGAVRLGPTTLYRYLHQLDADGWIEEADSDDENDPRRRRYRLTKRGRHVAEAEAQRLTAVLRLAKSVQLLPANVRL